MPAKGYSSKGRQVQGHRELVRRWRAEGREAVGPADLAAALGVNVDSIRTAYKRGRLPYTRVNRLIRFLLADVERWLELEAAGSR